MTRVNERLDALARAATVQILDAGGGDGPTWGSGFFVAPGRVLTVAHVLSPHLKGDRQKEFRVRGVGVDAAARLEQWLLTDPGRARIPLEEDLALVRLTGDPEDHLHECMWLPDRAVQHFGAVHVYGSHPAPPYIHERPVIAEINGHEDTYGLIIKPDIEFPSGMSGGPLVDPDTGAVVGLVKSRRVQKDGGMAVSISALRRFGEETYRTVMAAHDRWHGEEPVSEAGDNWIDLQAGPRAADGGRWTPGDRREALRLLASLPTPPDTHTVEILAARARSNNRWPGETPALLTWRDGHGLLYEGTHPLDSLAFLRYLRFAAEYTRCRGGECEELSRWIEKRLRRHPYRPMHDFVREASLPQALLPTPGEVPERIVIPYPGPGEGPTVAVLLDPVIDDPSRFFWQIWFDEGTPGSEPELVEADDSADGVLPRDLVQALRAPLNDLLRRKDRAGRPVPLEVALPAALFDTAVHRWRLEDIAELDDPGALGARRGVVLRSLERRGEPDKLWTDRWQAMTAEPRFRGWRVPVRGVVQNARDYHNADHGLVPVMCRPAGCGAGQNAMRLALENGHGVALWRIGGQAAHSCSDDCDTLHVRAGTLLGTLGSLAELPDRLRSIRQEISEQHAESRWAEPLALLYDDPRRPLPAEDAGPLDAPL